MPSALPPEDNDPVIASYDVYMTAHPGDESSSSRLFVLQYPSHQPWSKPYIAARGQKPTALRLKQATGMVEVDVPIDTGDNYNHFSGDRYGQVLPASRTPHSSASYGLAGGFSSGPSQAQALNLYDIPSHEEQNDQKPLGNLTLGGKVTTSTERDPVYMLGALRDGNLHLTHLDAVVQMRPQLHHIDAEEEIKLKRNQAATGSGGRAKQGLEAKLESKAIELKMKDTKEDNKDRNLNINARLLRDIQAEKWMPHDWMDESAHETSEKRQQRLLAGSADLGSDVGDLKSLINNDEWLDKMSVPRQDGKKGLRSKLKGRDRERARRKKAENNRRYSNGRATTSGAAEGITIDTSDSELSSANEHSDVEMTGRTEDLGEPDVKQEATGPAAAPATVPPVPAARPAASEPRKRGRPRKIANGT